ncbi:hypothetical protein AVEN_272420-1 [Araneus ventricosus]|uniref:Uncharacterized protein n=1 Tax=Araneus ventricosus TaxID=182803 RepID=A0A4Y2J113_ARAVE|nr:hypothetical protein AVEN_272420-1 [Araneus ventricosus]
MVKKGTSQRGNAGAGSSQISNADKYANDLKLMIDKISPEDYTEESFPEIMEWFNNLEKFSTEMVDAGLTYGKVMRNNFVKGHYRELLPIFQKLCFEIKKRDSDIFDLKLSLAEPEQSLLKAKVWTLERENASLRAKLELNSDLSSTIEELIPKIDELKNHNTRALKEELPSITKQAACPEIKTPLESVNHEIVAEVKRNRAEARSFAQVALQSKDLQQGASSILSSKEPEGILLIKPKDGALKDFEINRKILDILQTNSPEARLRGVGKIFGGGVKLIAASPDDIAAVKNTILEYGDKEILEKFDLVTPIVGSPNLYSITFQKRLRKTP